MTFLVAAPGAAVAQVPCLTGDPLPAASGDFAVTRDVRQVFLLNDAGRKALMQQGPGTLAYVHVQRKNPPEAFVRLLEGNHYKAPFSFSRAVTAGERDSGVYFVSVHVAPQFGWPAKDENGAPLPGCGARQISVSDPPRRSEFYGIRGQWWLAYRFPVRPEVGGSLFFGRLGVAGSVEFDAPRFFHEEGTPREPNRVSFAEEVRWRVSRGYFGVSARYYPDSEPDREPWRFGFVAGEELPSLKGLPLWMVIGIQAEPLSFSLAFRWDMPGSREP
jgi:hypothetical protein